MRKTHKQLIAVDLIDKMKQYQQYPPSITGFKISRMEYIIHLIISRKQKKHPLSYSKLNMKYMTNIVPKADEYINLLKQENIIEYKEYSANRNSRLYRLINEGRTEFRTITDKQLIYRIERCRRNIKLQNSKKYPILNQHIKDTKIDVPAALRTIEETYKKNLLNPARAAKAESRRTYSLAQILKFEAEQIYIKVNPTNYRLDSNITALPKELVKHLTIDDKPLYEMDVKNSQLFFVVPLTDPTEEIEQLMRKHLGVSLTMSVKSLQLSDKDDVKLYRLLVIEGKFYEYMMQKFYENDVPYKNRDNVKEQMFIVLFGKRNAVIYSQSARVFKKYFPSVHALFTLIKSKNHNKLSIFLQIIESYTILERVAKRITDEQPGIKFDTKHDSILASFSILTKKQHITIIQNIMETVIKEVTGYVPRIKVKGNEPEPEFERIRFPDLANIKA